MTWKPETTSGGSTQAGLYSSRPASATFVGDRYSPTDGGPDFVWDGTLWRPAIDTCLGYEPPSAGWTAIDGGLGASATFSKGVLELASTSVGFSNALALAVRSISGPSFDVKVRIRQILSLRNSGGGTGTFVSGIIVRDSATGNLQWLHFVANSAKTKQINISTYSNVTTFLATQISQDATQWADDSALWMRVVDNAPTSRTYYVSNDGVRWWQIWNVSWASRYPTTVDQIGLAHQGYIPSGTGLWDSGVRLESIEVI